MAQYRNQLRSYFQFQITFSYYRYLSYHEISLHKIANFYFIFLAKHTFESATIADYLYSDYT